MAIVNSIMATLHHLCAFVLTACLIFEFVAYRKGLGVEEARRIFVRRAPIRRPDTR